VTAQTCSFLAQQAKKKVLLTPEEAYTCGLLHDLGEVVLIDNLKDDYVALWTRAHKERTPLFTAEQDALGYTHCDVGARVATRWGLPPAIVHAIAQHHATDDGIELDPVVVLTSRANLLVERLSAGDVKGASAVFSGPFRKRLGIDSETEAAAIAFITNALQTVEI
jgi:putative nucleotidyltransferase with HDIG domain